LIELMVTVVIIAILAGMLLGALSQAQKAADKAATQALIAKLHGQLMLRYESYRTRRLPINTTGFPPRMAAVMRLNAIRELMRLEMPDRYSDLMTTGSGAQNVYSLPHSPLLAIPNPPAVTLSYQQRVNHNSTGAAPTAEFEDAECLYMILTSGLADDALGNQYTDPRSVGDADGDGMPEFQDSWGRPIRYIRCAPSFVSDIQIANPATRHDPFDPLSLDPSAFATYPLIYSPGLDHQDGIQHPPGGVGGFASPSTPYTALPAPNVLIYSPFTTAEAADGSAFDTDGDGQTGEDADNIHNHLIGLP
jgi:type II secretory pathway pseudopilin PulG